MLRSQSLFLLTRPSRGATLIFGNFSTIFLISTHTPLAGRDTVQVNFYRNGYNFYSHAPRGARPFNPWAWAGGKISTHTPLAGRDGYDSAGIAVRNDFYSHAPRGARPDGLTRIRPLPLFLLTRPSRGATLMMAAFVFS